MQSAILDAVAASVAIYQVGPDGRITLAAVNRAMEALKGGSAAEVIGRTASEHMPGRFGLIAERRLARVAATGTPATYEWTFGSGSDTRSVLAEMAPVTDEFGRVLQIVVTVFGRQDVARPGAQTVDPTMAERLAETERFVALAAHDLRAPLRQIRNMMHALGDGFQDLGDGKAEMIEDTEEIATRADGIIGELIEHSKAVDLEATSRHVDLAALCEDLAVLADPTGQHLIGFPDGQLQTDALALKMTLRNLLDNAIKHSGLSCTLIEIDIDTEGPEMLRFRVTNSGRAIYRPETVFAEDDKLRFERGFGTVGVRKLIEARGGTIRAVTPASGTGAEIVFTLPGRILDGGSARGTQGRRDAAAG